ncbi:unnamed protein product [Rotaria magnacalcarata]
MSEQMDASNNNEGVGVDVTAILVHPNSHPIMKLAEPALNVLFEQFQERSHETIRPELAHCVGLIGYVMLNEGEPKFAEWIFEYLNEVRKSDVQRQLLINAFRHSIQNEDEMLCLTNSIQQINEQLKKILESIVHAPLMIAAITDTIIDLSRIYPQIFQDIFVDIVDILIGWYIEPLPTDRILEYISQALHKFRPFWVEQIEATTLTLLDNFIEDADNYAQQFELHGNDDDDDIGAFTDKIAALYRLKNWPYEADVNFLRLIMKIVDLSDHDSCAKLASSIFAVNSRLWLYRFLYSNSLIQDVLQLFNRLLRIKSIPVVQQVYQAILADMTSNFNVLLNVLEQKTIVIGSGSVLQLTN